MDIDIIKKAIADRGEDWLYASDVGSRRGNDILKRMRLMVKKGLLFESHSGGRARFKINTVGLLFQAGGTE